MSGKVTGHKVDLTTIPLVTDDVSNYLLDDCLYWQTWAVLNYGKRNFIMQQEEGSAEAQIG